MFIISKEEYTIDMFDNRFETDQEELDFDLNNPEHSSFIQSQLDRLQNSKNVLPINDDLVFITGFTYDEAVNQFGQTVCDQEQTISILAEMLCNKKKIDYYEAFDIIRFKEFETKEDIEEWIKDIKNDQPLATVGQEIK